MCRMNAAWVAVLLLPAGCAQQRAYEIDLVQAPDFEPTGRLIIVKSSQPRLGPFLTIDEDWHIKRVEILGKDGRTLTIDSTGREGAPLAAIQPKPSGAPTVLGVEGIWPRSDMAVVADPELLARALRATTTQPIRPHDLLSNLGDTHVIFQGAEPWAPDVDKRTVGDWWAVALAGANDVTMQFTVPREDLTITLRGDPRQFGPAVLEVHAADGTLIKRYERQQVNLKELADGP